MCDCECIYMVDTDGAIRAFIEDRVYCPCDCHDITSRAVSEAVERIVEALDALTVAPVGTGNRATNSAIHRAIALLRSRDWSKGGGE